MFRYYPTLFGRAAKPNMMVDFDNGAKAVVHSGFGRRASFLAQMWDVASLDHFREPSDADLGDEIHETACL